MKIAVIPARGGSKRIPKKNIKGFCGKPMIAWPIVAARESGLFDHVIVSTDDADIAAVAVHWGAEAPFQRPSALADDYTGTTDVIAHAVRWASDQSWPLDAVCCIYATAPFVQPRDLDRGLRALESGQWAYAFAATSFSAPVYRAFGQHSDGGVQMLFPEHFLTRSQDLPLVLHDAGQFYWGRPSAWIEGKRIFDRHSLPVIIPRWRVQDIDDEDDWKRAELLFNQLEGMRNDVDTKV
jgi:N-acylneuraminate cytidylyltransferase